MVPLMVNSAMVQIVLLEISREPKVLSWMARLAKLPLQPLMQHFQAVVQFIVVIVI